MDRRTVEQHRLAMFGRFVMGVAHEVDNHLSVILGFAELIQISGGAGPRVLDGAEKILSAGDRIGAIVKQFSQHVRPHAPSPEPFAPGDVLSEVVLFARYDLCRGNVSLRPPDAWPRGLVRGDRRDFGLVLLAILLNGAEAMASKGGTLEVAASLGEGRWTFTVTDDGGGIDPALLPKVFNEGFTTKSGPYNTGMGLPVARHLAGGWGGEVTLANRPSGGCAATIAIPAG